MRRISQGGTVKLVVAAAVCYTMLHLGVSASAEKRPALPPARYPRTSAAPTPQRPTTNKWSADPNTAFAAKVKPGSFALVLNDGNRYIWTPAAEQKIPLETAFASVEVPLALIASVTFSDEQGAVKVAFRNGDIVTGKLLLKELEIRTAYGDLTVPISAMTFLGAGGVAKGATKPHEPLGPRSRYEPGSTLPPRPVPTARVDRVRR
ncbi:MAG: hypothetical protein IIA67_02735 [Planctomycetes bacterium]|nr:hypothetical protein [Planctomycetota bacterium]